jgi:hypothetical protein
MRRAVLAALLALAAAPAAATCPDWLVSDMTARGVPAFEMMRMCGPPATRSVAPPSRSLVAPSQPAPAGAGERRSNRCVTESGRSCATPSLRLPGSPCWCDGPGGEPEEGTIR